MHPEPARPHYAPGVPAEVEVPGHPLGDLVGMAAAEHPDRVAVDFLGATTTYRELAEQVELAAGLLQRAGVRPGDRVALVLPNCPQHIVAFYAVLRLGAVVAEHNPLAPAGEIEDQLRRHGAAVVVAWEKAADKVDTTVPGRTLFTVDLTAALPRRSRLLLRLPVRAARAQRAAMRAPVPAAARSWDREARRARARIDHTPAPADTAVLLHTGGTTGTPKAVALSHRNLLANMAQTVAWVPSLHQEPQTLYSVLPYFHAFGLTVCLTVAVRIAATQVVLPRFDVDLVLAAMRRRPATFLPGVPPMFDRLERAARERGVDLSSIGYAFSGAMALDPDVARRWEDATGGLVIEGYGMTECSPIALGNPLSAERRPGALGLPFPSTEIRIVDPEDPTVDVPEGQQGELLVRGPQVFQGYDGEPEETAAALVDGGWLRTGDIVRLDEGFVVLADRIKELILSGGFNVYPSQVEDAVRSMPDVADVAVVGLPDGSRGEKVVAALVLMPGSSVDLEQVRRWTEERLSHYAIPRQVAVLAELPRSQLGKVLRRAVREHLLTAGEHLRPGAKDR